MKYSTTRFLLISSFLVFALALTKPSIAADLEPVLDNNGEELRAGTEYYIYSKIWPLGGLTMASIGDQRCPLSVVKCTNELFSGLPATFTPVNVTKEGVIHVSTDLNIKFNASSTCVQSNVWRIQKSSNSKIQWSISIDGVEGNPGCDILDNWFRIEKSAVYGYKLVFYPIVCGGGGGILYRDIRVYTDSNGQLILSLSDKLQPYGFLFLKVRCTLSSVV